MKGASKVVDKPKNVQGKVMVGMTPVDAGKSKSAVKREKQKKKKEEQADAAANAFAEAQAAAAAAAATPVPSPEASIDPAKRARKLNKTLKQIEDLKTKDPGSLNDDQKSKVASEAEVWKELADLGL